MLLLQPVDIIRNRGCAGFDAPVIGIDGLRRRAARTSRVIQEQSDVSMQRALVAFQRQRIVAALIHELLRNGALAIERVRGHDRALERHRQQLSVPR
jgi:hypothetical protein